MNPSDKSGNGAAAGDAAVAGAGDNTSSSSSTSTSSARYRRLLEVLDRAVTESRTSIDAGDVVRRCYGEEDASLFGGDGRQSIGNINNNKDGTSEEESKEEGGGSSASSSSSSKNVLQSLLESTLERVHERVMDDAVRFLVDNNVEERLVRLEATISALDRRDAGATAEEERDKESARRAVQEAKTLCGGAGAADSTSVVVVDPADMVTYRAYRTMLAERDAVLKQISDVENECRDLEEEKRELSSEVGADLAKVETAGRQLEQSADLCSMVS